MQLRQPGQDPWRVLGRRARRRRSAPPPAAGAQRPSAGTSTRPARARPTAHDHPPARNPVDEELRVGRHAAGHRARRCASGSPCPVAAGDLHDPVACEKPPAHRRGPPVDREGARERPCAKHLAVYVEQIAGRRPRPDARGDRPERRAGNDLNRPATDRHRHRLPRLPAAANQARRRPPHPPGPPRLRLRSPLCASTPSPGRLRRRHYESCRRAIEPASAS